MSGPAEVDAYLAGLGAAERAALARLRTLIGSSFAQLGERISYQMPAFTYRGKYLIAYAAFTHHLSVFPGAGAIEANSGRLTGFVTSKGTVQFTLDHPLPDDLVLDLVRTRIAEIERDYSSGRKNAG